MCGITGVHHFRNNNNAERLAKITQSNQKLFLRGPDNGDIFVNDCTALGHRRLSIIDTSAAGSQPMKDPSGRYVIVFNGEIFNFRELSEKHLAEVWARIGRPHSASDTEVLLHLLIEYG